MCYGGTRTPSTCLVRIGCLSGDARSSKSSPVGQNEGSGLRREAERSEGEGEEAPSEAAEMPGTTFDDDLFSHT